MRRVFSFPALKANSVVSLEIFIRDSDSFLPPSLNCATEGVKVKVDESRKVQFTLGSDGNFQKERNQYVTTRD